MSMCGLQGRGVKLASQWVEGETSDGNERRKNLETEQGTRAIKSYPGALPGQ